MAIDSHLGPSKSAQIVSGRSVPPPGFQSRNTTTHTYYYQKVLYCMMEPCLLNRLFHTSNYINHSTLYYEKNDRPSYGMPRHFLQQPLQPVIPGS